MLTAPTVIPTQPDSAPAPAREVALPLMVDRAALAAMLAISTRHLARLDDSGRIPQARKLGRLKRWPVDEIHRWIEAGCPSRDVWLAAQRSEKSKKR